MVAIQEKKKALVIPKIRFRDFKDGWVEISYGDFLHQELREIAKPRGLYKGIGLRSHFKGTFRREDSDPSKISMEKLFKVKERDLIVNITFAWEGALAIAKKEDDGGLVSHRFPTFTFDESITTPEYFYFVFPTKKMKYVLSNISPGGAGRNRVLDKKDFLKLKVYLPSISEQQKITSFLGAIDIWLNNLHREVVLLRRYKEAMIQKIFSQEIRFKGEKGRSFPDWEEKKLGDIGNIRTSSIDKKINTNEKKVRLLNYMDVYKRNHIFVSDILQEVTAKDTQIQSCDLRKGDIMFTPSSETPDDIGRSAVVMEDLPNTVFSYHLVRLRPRNKILVPEFSAYAFQNYSFYKKLWRLAQGATRFTLSLDSFNKVLVLIPKSLIEQEMIGNFLLSLDKVIESKDLEIANVERWKKGLMQQLFI